MKTETTTRKYETTYYICEEDGCNFRTADKHEAERHPWKHKSFEDVDLEFYFDTDDFPESSTLRLFLSQEDYQSYSQHSGAERDRSDPWEGPGWYQTWIGRVPCGHGCCSVEALFTRPARKTLDKLRGMQFEINEALEQIEKLTH